MFKPFIFPIIVLCLCILIDTIGFFRKKNNKKTFIIGVTAYGLGIISCILFLLNTERLFFIILAFIFAFTTLGYVIFKAIKSVVEWIKTFKKEFKQYDPDEEFKESYSDRDNY